ncbi:uncharacterized protein [Mytilus edulis]|uniref:uncharacterized protein n=1 Tax=Mytilus edulis TaxID=6550 RepID=UPI0039EFE1BA
MSSFYLTETPTDSTVEQKKVESTKVNKPEPLRHIENLTETPTDSTVEQKKVESTKVNKPEPLRHIENLTETPTDSTVEQKKVESTKVNKPEPLRHIERKTWKKKRTAGNQSGTGIKQRKRIFRIFLKGMIPLYSLGPLNGP